MSGAAEGHRPALRCGRGAAARALALALIAAPARGAGEFAAGLAAYDAGDPERAYTLWLPLAQAGDVDAQNNLGWLYERGEGVARDLQRALHWYRKAAASDPRWQANLERVRAALGARTSAAVDGGSFEDGLAAFVAGDPVRAERNCRPLAEAGDADAQNNLGWLHEHGEGVERDLREALRWYGLAAAKDGAWAANRDRVAAALGGAPADPGGRFAEAMRAFERGEDSRAAALLEPLARAGHAQARTNLGYLHETGRGVSRDERRARDLYLLAARQGEPYAQNNLAVLLASGRGGDIDLVGAYRWFDIAARGGHPEAAAHLAALEPLLSASERAEAARLAREEQAP